MNRTAHAAFLSVSLLFGTAAAIVMPTDAKAACCVAYDYDNANGNKTQIITQLTERINAMQLAIIEAMRLSTGQLSGNSKEQIGAQSNMANVQDDRAVTGRAEAARMDAVTSAASGSSSCNVITGARGTQAIYTRAGDFSQTFSGDLTNWDIGGSAMPSSRGKDYAIEARLTRHCGYYANDDDVRSKLCTSAGSLPNASIDIRQSVFYQATGSSSVTLPQDRVDAAKSFLINALNPEPQGAMLTGDAASPQGREKAARRHANSARMSIAIAAADDILAKRTPQDDGQTLAWAQATAAQISGYSGTFTNGISWDDVMDIRAKGWFLNPSWAVGTDSQGQAQAVKDQTLMGAFQAYLGWETYKLIERQNMILAAMLAMQVEKGR